MDLNEILRRNEGDEGDEDRRDIEAWQTKMYSGAIGDGTPQTAVAEMKNFLDDCAPHKSYQTHANVRFVYEIMYKAGWEERVKKVVLSWVEVRNISTAVGGRD